VPREPIGRHALLAVPARARLVELVSEADGPVTAQQLAQTLGLHVTTVRFHLDLLTQAGLLIADALPSQGRGRPRIGYRVGEIDLAEVHEQMIDALARAVADRSPRDHALAAGHRWAAQLPEPVADPITALTQTFTRLGFAPSPAASVITLHQCPFADAARATPEVVCRVHLGLAQGVASRASAGRTEVDLVPFAEPGVCRLTVAARR